MSTSTALTIVNANSASDAQRITAKAAGANFDGGGSEGEAASGG